MVNTLRMLFLALVVALSSSYATAQMIEDPTGWTYELVKKNAKEYQLVFHAKIKDGWHIWSLKPGGDGYEIAPSFKLDAPTQVVQKGAVTEKGVATTTKMEGTEGKVTYLSGKIDYYINVTVAAGTKRITGKHTYQVCNDNMCLPPTDKDFVFELK